MSGRPRYLADVPESLGPPSFVACSRTADLAALPNWYPSVDGHGDERGWVSNTGAPELYDTEVSAAGPAGTVVAYTTSTFHRGTQLVEPHGARYTIHLNFKPASVDWAGRREWIEASASDVVGVRGTCLGGAARTLRCSAAGPPVLDRANTAGNGRAVPRPRPLAVARMNHAHREATGNMSA